MRNKIGKNGLDWAVTKATETNRLDVVQFIVKHHWKQLGHFAKGTALYKLCCLDKKRFKLKKPKK